MILLKIQDTNNVVAVYVGKQLPLADLAQICSACLQNIKTPTKCINSSIFKASRTKVEPGLCFKHLGLQLFNTLDFACRIFC